MIEDFERCYRAVQGRDRRFDGVFYTAVRSTGIYCRPSCPAITPQRRNVEFHRTAASAQRLGFRACKRCLPDATPGSPEWDLASDIAGRVMRLIADGVVDREGVEGLASRTGYSSRHLNRLLTAELGAGPLALARARRAQSARVLVETTTMGFADVAFAAGFASVRQFNDTLRQVYDATPSELRAHRGPTAPGSGRLVLNLPVREPFAAEDVMAFLGVRAVPGVEAAEAGRFRRTLRLPHGPGSVHLAPSGPGRVECGLWLTDLRDLGAAVERCRRLLDLDADPVAVDDVLGTDPLLGPSVRSCPGLRLPGAVDGAELAVRAVLGQQVSVAGARRLAGRVVEQFGERIHTPDGPARLFPSPETLAALDPAVLPVPRSRARALVALGTALASGGLVLDRGADRGEVRRALVSVPGVGPWTTEYVAMRALGDPDAFPATDLGVRRGLAAVGVMGEPAEVAGAWRPWRSYAVMHLWRADAVAAQRTKVKENQS